MGEDFLCAYEPQGGAVIEPMPESAASLSWSAEAETRLGHVPGFVRRFVRQRAEAFAREQGAAEVTAEHLETLARRRFGKAGPPTSIPGKNHEARKEP